MHKMEAKEVMEIADLEVANHWALMDPHLDLTLADHIARIQVEAVAQVEAVVELQYQGNF